MILFIAMPSHWKDTTGLKILQICDPGKLLPAWLCTWSSDHSKQGCSSQYTCSSWGFCEMVPSHFAFPSLRQQLSHIRWAAECNSGGSGKCRSISAILLRVVSAGVRGNCFGIGSFSFKVGFGDSENKASTLRTSSLHPSYPIGRGWEVESLVWLFHVILREFKGRGEGVQQEDIFFSFWFLITSSYSPAFLVAKSTSMNWKRIR